MSSHESYSIELGRRVILADATDRGPDVLGTVIALDPYPDRGTIVRVLFETRVARWMHRNALRGLDYCMSPDALADDLATLGVE
jgi:hypothetical protein